MAESSRSTQYIIMQILRSWLGPRHSCFFHLRPFPRTLGVYYVYSVALLFFWAVLFSHLSECEAGRNQFDLRLETHFDPVSCCHSRKVRSPSSLASRFIGIEFCRHYPSSTYTLHTDCRYGDLLGTHFPFRRKRTKAHTA